MAQASAYPSTRLSPAEERLLLRVREICSRGFGDVRVIVRKGKINRIIKEDNDLFDDEERLMSR